ncbi:MAG: HAD-IIIC family phosphatase [Prevotella sp.]|nr:HAD-IIIC family phosphatase [Prevotella sp.]
MKYFVFRNQTIEPFLGDNEIGYSGYGDISTIPKDAERFIWFYQVPFNMNSQVLAMEISTFVDKLRLVISRIEEREMWIFSLVNLFHCQLVGNDTQIDEAVQMFNDEVLQLTKTHDHLKMIDFLEFTSSYSSHELVNWKYYYISQMQLNAKLIRDFSTWFARKEEELAFKRKKCLVLDLDNTLWGGILGEDGDMGIQIGGDYPGNAFHDWQQALLELSKTGVLLTVCSKNDEQDVLRVWENHPFMVLRRDHFCAWRINWQDKATNIKELANELNISLDSMVFLDDSPSERLLVKKMLPMVCVPDFPDKPYELMPFFRQLVNRYFRVYSVTNEDVQKVRQYKTNAIRTIERSQYPDMDSYLQSLEMEISVLPIDNYHISRIAQLTQKTNQFNLTTHRLTEQDIRKQIANDWKIYCLHVRDKFGDDGITGAIFITPTNHIDNLLLSCRVLGKGIEYAFVSFVLNLLYNNGVKTITACYVPSAKNTQIAHFYDHLGFTLTEDNTIEKKYKIILSGDLPIKEYYHINLK